MQRCRRSHGGFVLDGNSRTFRSPDYEPLTDRYLGFFFQRNKVFKQLRKIHVLNRRYEIIDPSIKHRILRKNELPVNQFSDRKLNIRKLPTFNETKQSERHWILASPSEERSLSQSRYNRYYKTVERNVSRRN